MYINSRETLIMLEVSAGPARPYRQTRQLPRALVFGGRHSNASGITTEHADRSKMVQSIVRTRDRRAERRASQLAERAAAAC